jgi:hypothetical protein
MIEGVWPTVRDDDWCGEWKALVRRVDPSRLSDVLGAPLPAMPASATPLPGSGPPPAMPPMPPPRVNVQAARAALSALGIEGRASGLAPVQNLTGTGSGDD